MVRCGERDCRVEERESKGGEVGESFGISGFRLIGKDKGSLGGKW